MCGIAGWFDVQPMGNGAGNDAGSVHGAQACLAAMIDAIAHRGPDGRGALLTEHAALGHARLSIIDIDGGAQPMADVDNRAVIVFNGEIYNYRTLRDQLRGRGQRFATESDTETVLALYLQQGAAGLSRLRGLLARDPLGIKPLFVHQRADRLYFGSEAKALLGGGIDATLDEAALHLLLNFRYLPGEHSLFRGIRQLSPGTALCWTADGDITETRIERPVPTERITPAQSPQRLHAQILAALGESVQAHLVSDAQVGAYLSGGVDSAAVVALARTSAVSTMPTFTLNVGDDPAEAANAARSAALLQVDNRLATDTRPPAAMLPDLIRQLEVPKVNAWQVAELARHAARDVKVVLSGLGGDELFYGYNMDSIMARTETISRFPGAARRAAGGLLAAMLRLAPTPWSEPQRMALMLAEAGNWPRVYGLLRNVWDAPDLRRRLYGPRLLDQPLPDAFDELAARWPQAPDPVTAAARFEWREKMVNDLLWQEDRVSMAQGLEVRVPFVDQTLAEQLSALDRNTLMPRGRRKGLLRDSLQQVLPGEILSRPKSGFQVDAGQFWQQLQPLAETWLSDEAVRRHGLFNPDFVRRLRGQRPRTGLRWHFFLLYLMLGTHLWLHEFEVANAS